MKTFLEPLTPDEEKIYIEKMRLGDKKAKDILIERNLRLVAHVVKKYYIRAKFRMKMYAHLLKNGDIFQIKMDKYIYFIYVSPVMIHGQGSFGFR